MAVFRLTRQAIEPLRPTSFAHSGLKERADLQRLLKANISVVADDVLVIAEEFADWEASKRRIDLLGIDRQANLVVIELKRDDEVGHMELQAIRYAAMVSSMTFARATEVYQDFLDRLGPGQSAGSRLLDFLGWEEPREDDFARDVRIVLVAPDFSKELTTAALWLNERDLDIRCVRLKPYTMGSEVIVDVQQVVPLPETEAYTVQLKQKDQAVRIEKAEREVLRLAFWKELVPAAAKLTPRFADITPSDDHWLSASAGFSGLKLSYLVWQTNAGAELYIDKGVDSQDWNKRVFDYLHERHQQIEGTYGAKLAWYRLDEKRASRIIEESIPGGIRSSREQWPETREAMIRSMRRLEDALGPHLQSAVTHASQSS